MQIFIDSETVRAGETTPLMLVAPVEGMHVWFSIETDGMLEQRVVALDGTVKLIELDVDDRYVPNVFAKAVAVRDGELLADTKEIIVPPVDRFLNVSIEPDRDDYRPGADGMLELTVTDVDGRPARAEVAVALIDASVAAIQEDYAIDPRRFFYGAKRHHGVRTTSSFDWRRYAREGEAEEKRIQGSADERFAMEKAAPPPSGPALAGAMRQRSLVAEEGMAFDMADADVAQAGGDDAVQVRSDFRATAAWEPAVRTDASGRAGVPFTMPETLTEWTATARATTTDTIVGQGNATARTNTPLAVRLQTPRFLVAGDEATLSALINNDTEDELTVAVGLDADGLVETDTDRLVVVDAGGEARVDWAVQASEAGTVALRVEAFGVDTDYSDGMVRDLPVFEHGIDKLLASSGKARDGAARARIELPRERRPGSTEFTVQVAPSLAVTMLDALPYLIDYPYGCVEQTMSRFLPAAIVAGTLERLGLEPEEVATRIFGGIEPEHTDSTHTKGTRDLARLDSMIADGMKRLADMQHGDGGWGWWKAGNSDRFMTAYVVWGLGLARESGMRVDDTSLRRAATWLAQGLIEEEQHPDMQAFMLHAIVTLDPKLRQKNGLERTAFEQLWNRRDSLNAYTRSLLAISAARLGEHERARVLVRNLDNGVQRDRGNGTAHWGRDGIRWRWSDSAVEATSFALRAMLEIDPDNELIDPVVTWLVRNRRGAQWSNTRDTAITILALGDYLETSGELDAELDYTVEVNGTRVAERSIRRGDALAAPVRHLVPASTLRHGANDVRITRTRGDGPIYYSVEARFFSLEEPVTPAGNEIFVERSYFKLVPQRTLLNGYVTEKIPLEDGGTIAAGERVEVLLRIEAKNDLEYLVFEDLKPAGFEAVQLKSGEPLYATGPGGARRRLHQELRDRKVALFADKLGEGRWEVRYELRAETPGRFHALPVLGHAMYVPEIRGNGSEQRVTVTERASAEATIGLAAR